MLRWCEWVLCAVSGLSSDFRLVIFAYASVPGNERTTQRNRLRFLGFPTLGTSACARKSLRSDFGMNSAVVLGSGRKTLRKDLRFPALVVVTAVFFAEATGESGGDGAPEGGGVRGEIVEGLDC